MKLRKFYTGHTDNLSRRLKDHNAGKSIYTSRFIPWEVVYFEEFDSLNKAITREKYFKSAAGRRWLKKHVNN